MTDLAVADLSHIPVSQGLAATLTRASEGARATGAREVSLEHVLAALCDDSDAADVLAASHIDPARLKSETIAYLAQRDDGARGSVPGGQIAVSGPLMRILEAAAAAARGGRRRDINGAIVLAAIVGDGASIAAQLLQKHGLTFDGAIRALQAALAQPQRNDMPTMAPAEDVLARARERVQSRAAPSLRDIMLEKGQVPEKPAAPSQPGSFPDPAEPRRAPSEPTTEGAPSPQTGGSPPQPAKSLGEIGETLEQIRSASPAARQEASAKPPESMPSSASDTSAMGKPPSEPPSAGPVKLDPAEPHKQGSPDAPSAPAPSQQAGGANRQPPVEGPAATPTGPPPWVKTAPGPGLSPPAPTLAPPPSPAPPPQVQPIGASQASAPGQTVPVPAAAPNAMPLPPGLEVRRTGGPQPPPIPPPVPKAPPNQARFGAQPMARAPQPPPPGLPSGMPPAPGNLPGMPPLGRPQGAPSGVIPPSLRVPAPAAAKAAVPPAARDREATREPAKAELGQLTETIPRTMRVGVTERVEIRIGRAHIKNMADGMEGGGLAWQHDVTVTKAMSVRVRAPEGGFFIETVSPETQWIDRQFDDGPDYASWRFLITPQQRGWATLRIHISARTVGSEGVAAETAFPDQVIEVKVRTNYGRAAKRTLGWVAAAIAGGVLARFGEGAFDAGSGLISKLLG